MRSAAARRPRRGQASVGTRAVARGAARARRGGSRRRAHASRSPTAASISSTSATCAICRRRPREADRLVVAINDDRSVARLKGPGRPILWPTDRAELVAALRGVDYVDDLLRADGRRRCCWRCGPTSTARAPTTPSRPCPSAIPCAPTAAASPSSAIRRITRRATCSGSAWRGSGSRPNEYPDRPARCARRHRPRDSGGGGAAAAHPGATIDWLVEARHRAMVDLVDAGRPDRCARSADVERLDDRHARAAPDRLRHRHRPAGADEVGGARPRVGRRARRRLLDLAPARKDRAAVLLRRRRTRKADIVIRKNLQLLQAVGVADEEIAFPLADVTSPALDRMRGQLPADRPVRADEPRRGVAEQALAAGSLRRAGGVLCARRAASRRSCCGGLAKRRSRAGRRGVVGNGAHARPRTGLRRSGGARPRRGRWWSPAIPVRCTSPPPSGRRSSRSSDRPTRNATGPGLPTTWWCRSTNAAAVTTIAAVTNRRGVSARSDRGGLCRRAAATIEQAATWIVSYGRWRGGASPSASSRALSFCGWPDRASLHPDLVPSSGGCGEALRIWAAGHLEKSREVTTSGPYRSR